MANKKISQLDALGTAPAGTDILPITDVSGTPTTKSVTVTELLTNAPDNSTNVTLATVANNYLSLSGQEITAGVVPVSLGGTGSGDLANARANLGLGTASTSASTDFSPAFFSTVSETTTARTLSDSDNGKVIICTNANDVTITISDGLTSGFSCTLVQSGSGTVKVEAGGTATLQGYNSTNATAGQYASVNIYPIGTDSYILDGTSQAISPAGANDLHYTGGIYFNTGATYYIGTAPEMHFDAAILDGADPANNPSTGSSVSSFGNRSGSSTNYDASQATAGYQPTYRVSSGLSYVEVGNNNFMPLASSKSIGAGDNLTVIQVGKRTTDYYSTVLADSSAASYLDAAYYLIGTNSHYMMGTLNSTTSFTQTDLNSLHIIVSQRNSGSFSVWLNSGAAKISGVSNSTTTTYDRLYQGSNLTAINGDYYETLYFDSALSVSDINIVRSYLANKYSITSSAFS